jgi:hypothetical protein
MEYYPSGNRIWDLNSNRIGIDSWQTINPGRKPPTFSWQAEKKHAL